MSLLVVLILMPLLGWVLGYVAQSLALWVLLGRPCGMAGVLQRVPSDAHRRFADRLSRRLSLAEIFRLMEPEKLASRLVADVLARHEEYVDALMSERNAVLWDNLPDLIRRRVYQRVAMQLPMIYDSWLDDVAEHVEQFADVGHVLVARSQQEPALLAMLLSAVFDEELTSLRRRSAAVGLVSGVLLALMAALWPNPHWWMALPVVAGLSVYLPRWVWLNPEALPGLLPSWRLSSAANAERLATYLMQTVLAPRCLLKYLLSQGHARAMQGMMRRHMRRLLDTALTRTSLQLAVGAAAYARIKQRAVDRSLELAGLSIADEAFASDSVAVPQAACQERLAKLPRGEYAVLVRDVFQAGWGWQLLPGALLSALLAMLCWLLV